MPIFALWQRRAHDPLIDPGLFRRRVFSAGSLVVALHNLAMYSLLFELPQMSARLFDTGREGVGTLVSAMMASTVISAPIAGRLSDRLGPRSITCAGSVSGVLRVVALRVVPFAHPSEALPGLILLGPGLGLGTSPAQAAAPSAVPRTQIDMAAGVAFTLRYLGVSPGSRARGTHATGARAWQRGGPPTHTLTLARALPPAPALALYLQPEPYPEPEPYL